MTPGPPPPRDSYVGSPAREAEMTTEASGEGRGVHVEVYGFAGFLGCERTGDRAGEDRNLFD